MTLGAFGASDGLRRQHSVECRSTPGPVRVQNRTVLTALDPSFDGVQFLPVISDCCVGGGQQRSQPRLIHQVTIDLQDQSAELGAISGCHEPK